MDDSLSFLECEIDKRIASLEQVNTDYIDLLSFLHMQHKNLHTYNSLTTVPDNKDNKIINDDNKSKKDHNNKDDEDLVFGNHINLFLDSQLKC